jgi:hypothetical protein
MTAVLNLMSVVLVSASLVSDSLWVGQGGVLGCGSVCWCRVVLVLLEGRCLAVFPTLEACV